MIKSSKRGLQLVEASLMHPKAGGRLLFKMGDMPQALNAVGCTTYPVGQVAKCPLQLLGFFRRKFRRLAVTVTPVHLMVEPRRGFSEIST